MLCVGPGVLFHGGTATGAIPKWACMVIFSAMILTLEVLGGMNSVVLTDTW